MPKVGYARVSTFEQEAGLEAQIRDLKKAGARKIFSEQISGTIAGRPELAKAIDYAREGDTFIVTKPERLARSLHDLLDIIKELKDKDVALRILSMDLDTSTATGKLTLQVLGAVGEFERDLMLERQREGIARAKAAGKYRGRKPTARAKAGEVRELYEKGMRPSQIARVLGIGRSSVYRALETAA